MQLEGVPHDKLLPPTQKGIHDEGRQDAGRHRVPVRPLVVRLLAVPPHNGADSKLQMWAMLAREVD